MKKKVNKNARKNTQYNVKVVKMDKENAMEQFLEIMASLDTKANANTEYAMDMSCFTDEELIEFDKKMLQIMELRSNLRGGGYEMRAFSVPQLAF